MKMYLIGVCVGIIVAGCGAQAKTAKLQYRINPDAGALVTEQAAIEALANPKNNVEKCTQVAIKNVTKLASKKR
jgi:hypothetical protein